MSRTISTRFAVGGESEYKSAIKSINGELSTLKSELAKVSSEYIGQENSVEALSAKNKVLSDSYAKQTEKIATIQAAIKNAQAAEQKYSDTISEKSEELKKAEESLQKMKDSTEDTSDAESKLQEKISKLKSEIETATRGQDSAAQSIDKWTQSSNYAQVAANKLENEISQNNQKMAEAQSAAAKTSDSVEKYSDTVNDASENTQELSNKSEQSFEAIAGAIAAAGVKQSLEEIVSMLKECTAASIDFNNGMAETFTLLPDITESVKAETSETLLNFKTEFAVASDDATSALYQTVSAGVELGDSMEFLETAQKAAVGGVTDLTTSVDGLTSVTNAYGKENITAQETADKMFTAVKLGKTNFEELSKNLYNVIPTASSNKIAFDDITAAIAQMTAQGTPTAQATTQIRQMLVELTDSGSETASTFEKLAGVSFRDFIAEGGNTQQALEILSEGADKAGKTISDMFSSVEAGNAAIALSGDKAAAYSKNIDLMKNSSGACDKAFDTMSQTTEYATKKFASSAETLKISIGNVLEPQIKEISEVGTGAFEWAADFVEENPWVVAAFESVAAAIAILAVAVTGYTVVTKIAIPLITSFNAALAANPIGIVAIALGALITAVTFFVGVLGDSNEELSEAKDRANETSEAMETLADTTQQTTDKSEATTKTAQTLIDRLKELESQGLNTATAQQEYSDTVQQLNELLPELNLQIDENTGLIKENYSSIDAQVKSIEKQAKAKAYADQYTTALEKQAEAQVEVEKTTRKINELTEERETKLKRLGKIQEEIDKIYGDGIESIDKNREKLIALNQEQDELTQSTKESEDTISKLQEANEVNNDTLDETTQVVTDAKASYDDYNDSVSEAEESNSAAAESLENIQTKASELQQQMQDLNDAYAQNKEVAYENITSALGLFEEMPVSFDKTAQSIIDSLKTQENYLDDYSANLKTVMDRCGSSLSDDMATKLRDGSTESAEILSALAGATDDEMQQIIDSMGKVEKGKNNFSSQIGKMASDYDENMKKIKGSMDEYVADLNQSTEAAQNTDYTLDAIVNAVENGKPRVVKAYKELAEAANASYRAALDEHSPSKVFEKSTTWTIDAITQTAKKGEAEVNTAYKKLGTAAKSGYEATTINNLTDSLKDSMKEIEDSYKTLRKSHISNLASIEKDYSSTIKNIKKEYKSAIEDINKSIASRSEQLGSPGDLFGTFTDAESFIENMKNSNDALSAYKKQFDELNQKGLPNEFMSQIEELGVDSTEQLKVLNNMTDEQLNEYLSLWQAKQATASKMATKQYADEKAAAKTERAESLAQAKSDYDAAIAKENASFEKQLAKLELKAQKAANKIGESLTKGIKKGLIDSQSDLTKALETMVSDCIKTTKKAFKINSPSKEYEDISKMNIAGGVVGIEKNKADMIDSYTKMADESVSAMKNKVLKAQVSYAKNVAAAKGQNTIKNSTVNNSSNVNVVNNYTSPEALSPAQLEKIKRKERQELIARLKK